VQLPATAIRRFQQEVDWQRADAAQEANKVMRLILVEYVAAYLTTGAAGSMEYADQPQRLDVGREFIALAQSDGPGWGAFHPLRRHLVEFPRGDSAGIRDLIYWSVERVGRRPVASITHLAIASLAPDTGAAYAVASKHLYGAHYYDSSLGLTVLVRDRSSTSPATYVAYLNRSRVDIFHGLFGPVARKIVSGRARATVADQLARLKLRLQASPSPRPGIGS
jgi:hypothetical protein